MQIWLESWLRTAVAKVQRDERGQAVDLLVIAMLVFFVWLIVMGRRIVVQ